MELRIGQRWTYQTRAHEKASRVVIGAIEGDTYHVGLDGLNLCGSNGEPGKVVAHLPVVGDALTRCLLEHVDDVSVPPTIAEGIASWREAKGGRWTMPLADIVTTLEWAMNTPTAVLDHLVSVMRNERNTELIPLVMETVRKQPELIFLNDPNHPNAPLLWHYPERPPCVVVFTSVERAMAFAETNGLTTSPMRPPNADEAFAFLRQLRDSDDIPWASINSGHEHNVPYYLDQLG